MSLGALWRSSDMWLGGDLPNLVCQSEGLTYRMAGTLRPGCQGISLTGMLIRAMWALAHANLAQ